MAKVVVFEGPDFSGKGTQSKLLEEAARADGLRVVRVEHTKETHPWSKKLIYGMLMSGWAKRLPTVFQVVQFFNRQFFQRFRLPKLLRDNDLVILDRWALSGFVYGWAENINGHTNSWMFKKCYRPDVTLVMTGMTHDRPGTKDDSYEQDTDLQASVREKYVACNGVIPNLVLIDNNNSPTSVHRQIVIVLNNMGIIRGGLK